MKEIAAALGCGLVIQLIPPIHSDPALPSVESILSAAHLPLTPEPVRTVASKELPEETPAASVSNDPQVSTAPSSLPEETTSYYIEEREPDRASLSRQMSALFNPLLHSERKKRPERNDSIFSLLSSSRKSSSPEAADNLEKLTAPALPSDCINPLTGEEYLTNTVRKVPDKEGFVEVYDASDHSWTETNEAEFLRFQQQKKQMLGSDYEPPIYI